jgi:DNA invertase Pin-like site-specific DNA recombinase
MAVRCAIYTRKSSDEGLDQAFNSLDAQREACEAYVTSQKHEGWKALPQQYDDGGLSGGNLDRPALQRLMDDIDAGRVDMIIVYKIDRLTRSLSDFARLVDRLDAANASFVSVTQQFNTSTSMGRLTLNVLLSFAQFEREVTAERIRDKIAASKKKGMWMGGRVPLGYERSDTGLVINAAEADTVRKLFAAYLDLGCVRRLKAFAESHHLLTKHYTSKMGRVSGGTAFSRGRLYDLLKNPLYVGRIQHKGELYEGLHQAIVTETIWDQVQDKLHENATKTKHGYWLGQASALTGKIFDEAGRPLTPSHSTKKGKRYRYYISQSIFRDGASEERGWRLPAVQIEDAIAHAIREDMSYKLHQQRGDVESTTSVLDLVEQVIVTPTSLQVTTHLQCENDPSEHITLCVPMHIQQRGFTKKVVLASSQQRAPDLILIRRILRADGWLQRIKAGQTIKDIAAAESISADYITPNLDMALLSPAALKSIAESRQNDGINAKAFTDMRLPIDWATQDALIVSGN